MHKETKLAETSGTKIKRKIRDGNFVLDSFLKRFAKKSGHFFKFLTVSLFLADLHPDKILLFLRCEERWNVFGVKNMDIKVAEINVYRNLRY